MLPKINVNNIRSLKDSNPHHIGIIAYDKCLIYLNNIRSLNLKNIKIEIIKDMVSRIDFNRLERVIFNRIDGDNNWSLFKHFVESNQYPYLRTYQDEISLIGNVESLLSIEHALLFGVEYVNPINFFNFLNRCPNLKSIRILTDFRDEYVQSGISFPIPLYNTITHLDLMIFGYFNEKIILYLFKNVSQVHRLKLRCFPHNCPQLVDPSFWEICFSIYLVRLKRFYLDTFTVINTQSIDAHWNFLLNKEEICQKLEKSTYWSSHGWKPTYFAGKSTSSDDSYSVGFVYY